jgi:hypothetical protein
MGGNARKLDTRIYHQPILILRIFDGTQEAVTRKEGKPISRRKYNYWLPFDRFSPDEHTSLPQHRAVTETIVNERMEDWNASWA